ncbi:FCD domain-containing protein [Litorivicinus lipolyticus]|uniref:FCD domain-containing protein n=1 Tax=Litorivicinus lipolyticus TaxID=418701 RepID=A0A5Q2QB96_9GAMM|nr:GntR family transcriptional regulator [Litorivicinus lipolyticus]QGG79247.1 FCD domain-containing protein [Litorivicinus lipolyticus]
MSKNATDRIFEALEERIVTGTIKSGERIDETAAAEQFGVSRTPVREAFARLAASDLIEKRDGQRGYFASAPSITRLIEMFEVMAELEGMCARLASRRMRTADIERLKLANEACHAAIENNDPDLYYALNVDFHEIVYNGCGNRFLADETRQIRHRLKSYRRLQLRVRGRMNQSLGEHSAIIEAIVAGDAATAERLSKAHVSVQGERFADLMAQL